jgi:hypothetical protein
MSYEWYNNKYKNKKIYSEDEVPEGFIKGYYLNKERRLKKLNALYENKIKKLEQHYKEVFEEKKEKLLQELLKKQHQIITF